MTEFEWALLVLSAIVLVCLLWDTQRLRGQVKDLQAANTALWAALGNQAEKHQEVLDRHAKEIARAWNLARAVDRQIPNVQRIVAQAERNVKGDFWRRDGEVEAGVGSEAERTRTAGDPDRAGG